MLPSSTGLSDSVSRLFPDDARIWTLVDTLGLGADLATSADECEGTATVSDQVLLLSFSSTDLQGMCIAPLCSPFRCLEHGTHNNSTGSLGRYHRFLRRLLDLVVMDLLVDLNQ